MINFDLNAPNQLLCNPRISEEERAVLNELHLEFENEFGNRNYILVPSSGSSRGAEDSVKLIALKIDRILNSANRVNHYLQARLSESWALVLPEYHVAGVGVLARAYLTQAKVYKFEWSPKTIVEQIANNNVTYISMVPTQIYDLINEQARCPKCVKKVFVGGGALSDNNKNKIIELGWPVTETFGMTETASMVAVREKDNDLFQPMNNVFVKVDQGNLSIRCDSLLTASVQKRAGKVEIKYYDDYSWFATQDRAELMRMNAEVYLKLLGRESEYIKILGEGVSLSELRNQLANLCESIGLANEKVELTALEHERDGFELVLAVESDIDVSLSERLMRDFNLRCRPYEKLKTLVVLEKIPRSNLGKVLQQELKDKIRITI